MNKSFLATCLLCLATGTVSAQSPAPQAAPIRLKLPTLRPTFPPLSADPNTVVGLAMDTQGRPLGKVRVAVRAVVSITSSGDPNTIATPVTATQDANRSAWAAAHGGSYETNSEADGTSNGIRSQDQTRTWSATLSPSTGGSHTAVTDDGGRYRTTVPSGQYRIDAALHVIFEGEAFDLPLCPVSPSRDITITDGGGVVENFVWTMSGLKAGAAPDQAASYYGAGVWLSPIKGAKTAAGGQIEVILTPIAALADGSAGAPLTFQTFLRDKPVCWKDVPLGRYTVRADRLLSGGQRQPLVVSNGPGGGNALASEGMPRVQFRPTRDGTPEAHLVIGSN